MVKSQSAIACIRLQVAYVLGCSEEGGDHLHMAVCFAITLLRCVSYNFEGLADTAVRHFTTLASVLGSL